MSLSAGNRTRIEAILDLSDQSLALARESGSEFLAYMIEGTIRAAKLQLSEGQEAVGPLGVPLVSRKP